jgi:UDP-3-O-[3-hydroxymyristoyl] glucosamine N-acyltransferase
MVGVKVNMGVNVSVGMRVWVGVNVSVGVKVDVGTGVSVQASAVADNASAVARACASGEVRLQERTNSIKRGDKRIFFI